MGVVAPSRDRLAGSHFRAHLSLYCAAGLYATIVGATAWRHEPWADEAQSWLLARDASLIGLWTKLLHYEGSPGLWHTLLHIHIKLGFPYLALNIVSGALGFAAAWLLLWYAPLPIAVRLLLPFTFFMCYQYAVVARSYSLLPLLLFACATLYKHGDRRLGLFTVLLCLIAAVSVHGFVLSISIWIAFHFAVLRRTKGYMPRNRFITAGVLYAAALVLIAASAWPARDVSFVTHPDMSFPHLIEVGAITFREAFTGHWIPSTAVVVLSIPFLWRGQGLFVFLLSAILLCTVGAVIYTQVWHYGLLLLAWLFAIWIASDNTRPTHAMLIALAIVIGFQCYWTIASVRYDLSYPYSGAREAAAFLRTAGVRNQRLYGVGFACTAIQPYFPENVFANFNSGMNAAFWDWSTHNHTSDIGERLFSQDPDYVIVGYKRAADQRYWTNLTAMSGYDRVRHFDGNLFWRTRILEPEAFDVYKRGDPASHVDTISAVNMADPAGARQLLSGFYGLESGAWRWTERNFSVALKRPPEADRKGAQLVLNLLIPQVQIQKLGPMTLTATVSGHRLGAETFSSPGPYSYRRDVPAKALRFESVLVSFQLDKAAPGAGRDVRELGAVVTSILLLPK